MKYHRFMKKQKLVAKQQQNKNKHFAGTAICGARNFYQIKQKCPHPEMRAFLIIICYPYP